MKQKTILLLLAFTPLLLLAQTQRTVLTEQFTAAWCLPCAGQNPVFQILLDDNKEQVISIKYQAPGGDPMGDQNPTQYSQRSNYYNVFGIPQIYIDGVQPDEDYADGAIEDGAIPGLPNILNQAVFDYATSQMTPIALDVEPVIADDFSTISVDITITNVSDEAFTLEDGRLHVVLVEKEIFFEGSVGGTNQSDFYNVMRQMYPDANGTEVGTIAPGESMNMAIEGDVPNYIYDNYELEVVAFVQDNATTEIWQAARGIFDFTADYAISGTAGEITGLPETVCAGGQSVNPTFELVNGGNETLTTADIIYSINGGEEQTINWTGAILTLQSEMVELGPIPFDALPGDNTLNVRVENPNGGEDENTADNSTEVILPLAGTATDIIELTLTTDQRALETYWQLANSMGTVVASGGNPAVGLNNIGVGFGSPASEPGTYEPFTTYTEEIPIDASDCYTFTITDYYSNGMCCTFGNGSYELRDSEGNTIVSGGEFKFREDRFINGELTTSATEELTAITDISLFPNPASETVSVDFLLEEPQPLQLEVFNATGQRVLQWGTANYNTGRNQLKLDIAQWSNGLYFLRFSNTDRELSRRFVVQH